MKTSTKNSNNRDTIEKWWNDISDFYQAFANLTTKTAIYGPFSPNESELGLLGDVNNKEILEIGCGGGQNLIAFSKQGANCTGVDISAEQLKYARQLAKDEGVEIKYIKDDMQQLKKVKKHNHYDIVFSVFALEYVPDLTTCFKNVFKLLKKDGLFVFSIVHPFYLTISRENLKITRSYYSEKPISLNETWKDGSKHTCILYTRKMSDIYNSLKNSGFLVEEMIEPLSFKDKRSWHGLYKPSLAKLIAPTLIFKNKKI